MLFYTAMRYLKKTFKMGIVLFLIGITLACSTSHTTKALNRHVTIMPLGDSITYGVDGLHPVDGLHLANNGGYRLLLWNTLVREGADIDYVGSQKSGPNTFDTANEGHPGYRIDQIAANIFDWLNTYRPNFILLHIGTNDIAQNDDVADAPARLSNLIGQITTTVPNATLIVAQILPIANPILNAEVETYNAAIPSIVQSWTAQGKHVHYVDMYDAVPVSDLPDGIHPTNQGYGLMANVWNTALIPLLPSITASLSPSICTEV